MAETNGSHFADNIFKLIFLIEISLKFVPKGPINNIPTLVQIMARHLPGDKPLSEPVMVRLPTPICITWPQWVRGGLFREITRYIFAITSTWSVQDAKNSSLDILKYLPSFELWQSSLSKICCCGCNQAPSYVSLVEAFWIIHNSGNLRNRPPEEHENNISSLQWCHMSIMASQITINSTFCLACSG